MEPRAELPSRVVIDTNLLLLMLGLDWGRSNGLTAVQMFSQLRHTDLFPGNLAREYSAGRLEQLIEYLFDRGIEIFTNSLALAECKIHRWNQRLPITSREGFVGLKRLVDDQLVSEHPCPIAQVLSFNAETLVIERLGITDVSLLLAATNLKCALMTEESQERDGLRRWAEAFSVPVMGALDIPND